MRRKIHKISKRNIKKRKQRKALGMKNKKEEYTEWKRRLQERVLARLDYTRNLSDEEVREVIDQVMLQEELAAWESLEQVKQAGEEIFCSLRRLDVLQGFIDDPAVTEIMVNGAENIYIEQDGALKKAVCRFESKEKLQDVIQQIVAGCNRVVNEASPIVDARLDNGARVNIVMDPVALNGPIVTIRRFPDRPITMQDLIADSAISLEAADFLKGLVKAKYNILISGGTGSGKTTFLNVLSGYIPPEERIVTIEDSAELQLQGLGNVVSLETRNKNMTGCGEITIRDLIRTSLRMRPDRIIVGEVRGAEAVDMMQALNTGHDGSMSTAHANSAGDLLFRLENMIMMGMDIPLNAIRRQISSGVDIVVHLSRFRDRSRRVEEIQEIIGFEKDTVLTQTLFAFEEYGVDAEGKILGQLVKKGELIHDEKLKKSGICQNTAGVSA